MFDIMFGIIFIEIIFGLAWGWMNITEVRVSVHNPIEDIKDLYSWAIDFWLEPFQWGSLLLKALVIVHGVYFFIVTIVMYILWAIIKWAFLSLFFIFKHVFLFLFKSHKKR